MKRGTLFFETKASSHSTYTSLLSNQDHPMAGLKRLHPPSHPHSLLFQVTGWLS